MKEKKQKERKLSEAELKRKVEFEQLTEKLVAEGYTPNHITMTALEANMYAVVAALPFIVLLVLAYVLVVKELSFDMKDFWIAYFLFIVFVVVHELIHGVTWAMFCEDRFKSISFGFIKEYLTPYCTCSQPMKKYQILIGSLMPTIILGFILGVVSILTSSQMLLIVSVLNILGGGGDLMVTFKLLKYKSPSKDTLFIDHPYEIGTAVFEK